MNVYAKDGGGFLGWATLPFSGSGGNCDGVVIADKTVPGGTFAPFNEGDTLTHEVGRFPHSLHSNLLWRSVGESQWLTLFCNTMQGIGSVCSTHLTTAVPLPGRDGVDDTPCEATPAFGCPVGRDTCTSDPGADPIQNHVDCADDSCMNDFTPGQTDRLQALC